MSGLAEVLLGRGFTISGSDSHDSDLISNLRAHGAAITIGQKAGNITPDIDVVVYTAAVRPGNPEYDQAVASGLPMLSRAELLGEMMQNYSVSIAVAGTHGKTTTTSMVSHVFLAGNYDPTIIPLLDAEVGTIYIRKEGGEFIKSKLESKMPDFS